MLNEIAAFGVCTCIKEIGVTIVSVRLIRRLNVTVSHCFAFDGVAAAEPPLAGRSRIRRHTFVHLNSIGNSLIQTVCVLQVPPVGPEAFITNFQVRTFQLAADLMLQRQMLLCRVNSQVAH